MSKHRQLQILGWVFTAILVMLGLWPGQALAAWSRAESDRFIVYSDVSPEAAREYAMKLTAFDAILRLMNPVGTSRDAGQKVDVYLVRNHKELEQVWPGAPAEIAGFYKTEPTGLFAIAVAESGGLKPDTVLFHEYAHHFMLENFPSAYPAWYIEGWAEYFSTASITQKDFTLGLYNENRREWLVSEPWIPLKELISKPYTEVPKDHRDLYYPQAWFLVHYMMDTRARSAQLDTAIRASAMGEDPATALEKATGESLDQLTRRLQSYVKLQITTYPISLLKFRSEPSMSALPPSADDLLLADVRLRSGEAEPDKEALLADIRRRAAAHPGDRLADLAAARAEFRFGDPSVGETIVNRRIAADPQDADALRLAAVGEMAVASRNPGEQERRARTARGYLAKAYALDPNDFRTLYEYVDARRYEAGFPTDNDVNVLVKAHLLAPAVAQIAIETGQALISRGRRDEAVAVLTPVANNPHGGPLATQAQFLLSQKP